jgi:SAM-dependent methyltransferase
MPATDRWAPSSRQAVWTARTVAWYERANARSNYARHVLDAIAPLVAECRSVLDVGAGFGALTLPLARRLQHVTALEPSPPMAVALRRAASRARADNVTVIEAAWGEVELPPHDLVVCAHVGPLLGPDSPFLAEVGRAARRGVALVRDVPGDDDKFFFSELYPLLLGRPYGRCAGSVQTLRALREQGIIAGVTPIEYRSDQPFDSLDEACEFWTTHLGRDDAPTRAFLREFLAGRLRREGDQWVAPYGKRALVLHWRV